MRAQITTGSDKLETVFGIQPGLRVSRHLNDGNLQARVVHGNGVALMWAPDGRGWPQQGTDWNQAQQACQYLTADGLTILP